MKKFTEEIKNDLQNYLSIENKNIKDVRKAIKYLESYHFKSVAYWHADNYYYNCNDSLLFGLCGLNESRQQDMQEMLKDCFNIIIF